MKQRTSSTIGTYDILNTDLFKPESWAPDSIDATVEVLEGILDGKTIEPCMEALLSVPPLLHLFMSAVNDKLYSSLRGMLLDQFPTHSQGFEDSLSWKFVSTLSLSLVFIPYPSRDDTPIDLPQCRRAVELAGSILAALQTLNFVDNAEEEETNPDFQTNRFVRVKPKTQRQQKKTRQINRGPVDPTPFNNLGVAVPASPQLADKLAADIFHDLKGLLQYYLNVLRRPSLREHLKSIGVPGAPAQLQSASTSPVMNTEVANAEIASDDDAPAYPIIQPMKAALYFESAKGLGDWHILISTRANADIREARRKDSKTFRIIIKKIKELSNGHFSGDNQKRLTGPNLQVPIYEAKMSRDLRLVYQIDCIPEFDSDVERQVIKVFGVYTHAQMDDRLWDYVGHQLSSRGREYRRRCAFRNRPAVTGDNVYTPASFPPQEMLPQAQEEPTYRIPCEYLQEIHSLLVLEKFVTLSQALLNSILADRDVAHVFAVSPQEREVIEHPSSCYVIGRSGTGKTTTMLFKMLGIQRSWELSSTSLPKPRQIFVTRSRVLAGRVEEYFSKLMKSLAMASQTSRQLLELPESDPADQENPLVDPDEEDEWRSDLPKRFSLLGDDHFPLFLSFDQLCRMLEEDVGSFLPAPINEDRGRASAGRRKSLSIQTRNTPVTYEVFLESYWPHLPAFLTKGLDPSLVFSEIMGVIKGSEHTLHQSASCLDRQSYLSLSRRCHSTFASQRDRVYRLFESYQKRRQERRQTDTVDRTHHLLRSLGQNELLLAQQVDFLYVDEVQDNHLIDAYLLRSLCKNPHGLFWAGDSAQTISVGSSFRFDDLKAFLWRVEQMNTVLSADRQGQTQPRTFQLTTNYRSHGGIVRCAHSIVTLLTSFWPYSIDAMDEEKGVVDGLKPVFFGSWAKDTLRYEQFLFGDSKSRIEFGARQCILVRNEAAREALRAQVGEIGLILTLYESKGLEFDDVLLYKFFDDSALDVSQWRLVLNGASARHAIPVSAPLFDEVKHAGVCSELKFLYVAITRARNNLWIFDPSLKAEPMKVFWNSHDLIEIYSADMHLPQLAVASTPEEWSKSGRSLFENKRYFQAMHCFKRAGMVRETAVAHAFYLRDQARSESASRRHGAFNEAAEAFVYVAEAAGKDATKHAYYKIAAHCYLQGDDVEKAAQAFLSAKEYTSAAQGFRQAGMFNEAVAIIQNHRIENQAYQRILHAARLYYFQRRNHEEAVKLFPSSDESLDFMENYGFDDARASLLERMGRYAEAAELHLSEGRVADAIGTFLRERTDERAAHRAKQCLVDCLWQNLSFGRSNETEHSVAIPTKMLLQWAMQIDPAVVRRTNRDEVSVIFHYGAYCCNSPQIYMFKTIVSGDKAKLQQLGQRLHSDNDKASALLCFNHAFVSPTELRNASAPDVAQMLQNFLIYVHLIREFALHPDPVGCVSIKRLFGFLTPSKQEVFMPTGTFLHRSPDTRSAQFASLLAAANLAFAIDGQSAREYVVRSPYVASFRSLAGEAPEYYASLIHLLHFLDGSHAHSLSTGVFFVRHILLASIPIDVNVLFNLTERLCGSLVLCRNYQRSGTFHGICLPRNWILELSSSLETLCSKDASHLLTFVKAMTDLLMDCAVNSRSALLFEGRSISKLGMPMRGALVARLCICLLGDNLLDWNVRDQIHQTICSMRRLNPQLLALCNKYVIARSWSDLALALRYPSRAGATGQDELIQMHDLKKVSIVPRDPSNVRRVPFKTIKDIPYLITVGSHSKKARTSGVSLDTTGTSDQELSLSLPREDIQPDHIEESAEDHIGTDSAVPVLLHSEEQMRAAQIIQSSYRRFQRRQRSRSHPGLQGIRLRFWEECCKYSESIPETNRRYRHLYLGPLVHILVCLELVHSFASISKEKAKKKWKEAQHEDLEDAGELLTKINKLLKEAIGLQKLLQPSSGFHNARDSNNLAAQASKLDRLVHDIALLPSNITHQIRLDLELGLKGFAQAKHQPKKPLPRLQDDDSETCD
ncbi:hypothetical protein GLOTRDRAFT_135727 [Gloeophyllum trabeum ATCC 11539]|uniref:UvrD-like helicase ATP-binding domain-containing protein n=1 Tax=Gloeophyllum trabeum (strain ATCC 11539 / FP-39264 / Madison 617) TaxID=670483 RepID=S7QNU4_GLOTA|nr:uncharacterized protein GLOTRDRAFT_135727 [Gloeophyllum trabeum ATCC 11539]EPQ61193.1 hypothetical protein GLOTRDRAFT_135727 [Gloeophyllum trabeum ATCC 11539]